jgi:hypothetical protein
MNLELSLRWLEVNSLNELDAVLLKKIYRKLALKHHPDKGGKAEDFIMLKKAYLFALDYIKPKTGNFDNRSGSQDFDSDGQYSQIQKDLEFYRSQYQSSLQSIQKYKETINFQVTKIREFQSQFNHINNEYKTLCVNLESTVKSQLQLIEKKYIGKWWQNLIGVNIMSKSEYVLSQNEIINAYNTRIQDAKDKYNNDILNCYEEIINKVIETLN